MKKQLVLFLVITIISCGIKVKSSSYSKLYEVLTQQETGGASIKFFEILSEENEIKMLLSDENLRSKIKPDDIKTANFVILNLGSKNSGGYFITIDTIIETGDNIKIKTKETSPKQGEMVTDALTNPYTIIKINSKKEIIFE